MNRQLDDLRALAVYLDDVRAAIELFQNGDGQARLTPEELGQPLAEIQRFVVKVAERLEPYLAAHSTALRASRSRYQALVDTLPVALFVNRNGRIAMANSACVALFGAESVDDLLGRSTLDFVPPEDHEVVRERIRNIRVGGPPVTGVHQRIVRLDGAVVETAVAGSAYASAAGKSIQVVLRDVTEERRAAARIQHLNAMLEGIRRVNQLITRERSPETLLRRSVEILVETRGLASASIVLRDPFGHRVAASAGSPERTARFAERLADPGPPPPCVARAMAGDAVVVVADPATTCVGCRLAGSAGRGHIVVTLPLTADGHDFGAVHAVLPAGGEGSADEFMLLSELASDVAFALRSIELESQVDRTLDARRRAELALRESAEQYRSEFEHSSAGRCLSSPDGRILRVNPALAAMLGRDTDDFVGRAVEEFIHPDDLARSRELGLRLLGGEGTSFRHVMRFLRADGAAVWTDLSVALYRGTDGTPVHFITDVRDLTAQKQAEAQLAVSETRYRSLIESLDDLVYTLDREGRLTYVSAAVAKYGYAPADVIGRRFQEFAHPDDRAALAEAFAARLEADAGPYEFRVFDGTGSVRVVRSSGRRLFEDGSFVGLGGVLIDLTAQRSTEEQLRAAQKMEAVGRLAGGVAHDFNNLLTVINSYAQLAARGLEATDRRREELAEIQKAGERAAALTRQLLAFSRRQVLQPVVLDPNAVIAGMEKMLGRLLGEDVTLEVVPDPKAGRFRADPGQVEQVLMNLAVNARDAMPGGGALTIESSAVELDEAFVQAHRGARTGGFVRFRVRDTGSGMDAATRERLFEPFFTTKPAGKGTGLGLATVYGIVKQSGGSIWVESEPGVGSTFDVYFPRVEDPAPAPPAPHLDAPTAPAAGTILFVEDDESIRALAGHVLADEGFRVLLASTGGEALVLAERERRGIDLVVTDVVMPGMNGRELALRLQGLLHDTPVLFMSGYGHDAISQHGVLDPGTLFLAKPFTPEGLAAKVREVLQQVHRARAGR